MRLDATVCIGVYIVLLITKHVTTKQDLSKIFYKEACGQDTDEIICDDSFIFTINAIIVLEHQNLFILGEIP
jgi:hypothetical protein